MLQADHEVGALELIASKVRVVLAFNTGEGDTSVGVSGVLKFYSALTWMSTSYFLGIYLARSLTLAHRLENSALC